MLLAEPPNVSSATTARDGRRLQQSPCNSPELSDCAGQVSPGGRSLANGLPGIIGPRLRPGGSIVQNRCPWVTVARKSSRPAGILRDSGTEGRSSGSAYSVV